MSRSVFDDAVVAYANVAQFGPGQRVDNRLVESRMLLWCKSGRGGVTANDQRYSLEPGRYLILPWKHRIVYQAEVADPFQLAGIHIIPRYRRGHKVVFNVDHGTSSPLAGCTSRADVEIPAVHSLRQRTFGAAEPLAHLAEYVLGVFLHGTPTEWLARQMAPALLHECVQAAEQRRAFAPDAPPELERMMQYVAMHVSQPLSLCDLVDFSGLSAATVGRMYRKHLHTTPVAWIQQRKMTQAGALLRTRRLSVVEVGEQVGIPDPHYFTKCFRKHMGQSPRDYRRSRHGL